MRSIGTIATEQQAKEFSNYLTSLGMHNNYEPTFDPSSGYMYYQIWIHDEDKIDEAIAVFQEFQQNPEDPKYHVEVVEEAPEMVEEEAAPPRRFGTHLTHFFIALCAFLFFINTIQQIPVVEEGKVENLLLLTPIQSTLMYDFPDPFYGVQKIIEKYHLADERVDELPPEAAQEVKVIENSAYWRGLYDWVVLKLDGKDTSNAEGPLFTRIREGEVWRLFTPCLMHTNLLHILFNMLWLWYLGRPIEQRIGPLRMLVLTLVVGIFSNTLQYVMSGPFFIGYSGVVMGLAGFTWMRERVAPWEGYPLNKATIAFLLLFILAIFALQVGSFFVQAFTALEFSPNIANTAHIAGAVVGAVLGRLSFFAQRVHK